jgi:hypothetical protein
MYHPIDDNLQIPAHWRAVEGLSTGAMWAGYLAGGGKLVSPLSAAYLIHWMSSIHFHLWPSTPSFLTDAHLIDMVCMLRLSRICGFNTCQWFLACMRLNGLSRFWVFGKISVLAVVLTVSGNFSHALALSSVPPAIFFLLGDMVLSWSWRGVKPVVWVLFHLSLGVPAMIEVSDYRDFQGRDGVWEWVAVAAYVLYAWVFFWP